MVFNSGRRVGTPPDVLQAQLWLRLQGGGHDQRGRAPGLEADVQGPHHEGPGREKWKAVLKLTKYTVIFVSLLKNQD